jgi:hypothetical protein
MMGAMSRAYARRLVGQVLHLPAIIAAPRRPPIHLKIIQIVVDQADPRRVVIHGIRVEPHGREFEGRTIVLTPAGVDRFLALPPPRRRRWQRSSPPSATSRSPKR